MNSDIKEKLWQLFIVGYKGENPPRKIFKLIENNLGGIIFFAENLKNRKHFKQIIKKLNQKAKTPLFFSIDQEGGLVERTIFLDKKIEYLTSKALSNLKNKNDFVTHYDILAKDLIDLGVNLNFAPVVDVNSNPKNPIIGVRSFGDNPDIVNKFSKEVIKTFKNNHILSCVKHYPGHGDTDVDSHKNMPVINMEFDEFQKKHLICFKEAIKNKVDTIMVSHIHFPFFDKETAPASLSKNAINYLKNELKFGGIVFSDDMVMGGISKYYGLKESIILAIKAGIDSLIFRSASEELIKAIDEIAKLAKDDKELREKIESAYEKIVVFKEKNLKQYSKKRFGIKKNQQVIDKIAEKTIVSEGDLPKFTHNTKIKIVSFNNKEIYNLSNNSKILEDFFKNYDTKTIYYPIEPAKVDIKKINNQIDNDDVVIFLAYNIFQHKTQIKLYNSIKAQKIFVSCALDDIELLDKSESVILLSCAKPPSLRALANKLLKK